MSASPNSTVTPPHGTPFTPSPTPRVGRHRADVLGRNSWRLVDRGWNADMPVSTRRAAHDAEASR